MSESGPDPSKLKQLASTASALGKSAVMPALQSLLRREMVSILSEHDAEELERYIDVQYPLVENEIPEGYESALREVGPQFSETVAAMVTPEQVMAWLEEPEEWMDTDANAQEAAEARRCAEIIRTHPQGEPWLEAQVFYIYEITGVLDTPA